MDECTTGDFVVHARMVSFTRSSIGRPSSSMPCFPFVVVVAREGRRVPDLQIPTGGAREDDKRGPRGLSENSGGANDLTR